MRIRMTTTTECLECGWPLGDCTCHLTGCDNCGKPTDAEAIAARYDVPDGFDAGSLVICPECRGE